MMKKSIIILAILSVFGCCGHRRNTNNWCVPQEVLSNTEIEWTNEQLYYRHTDTIQKAWNDSTLIFHHWKDIRESEYLFSVPTSDTIIKWMADCEEKNKNEGYQWLSERYKTMNQYVTVYDICSFCFEKGGCVSNKEFLLWRLEQFRTDSLKPTTPLERFVILKNTMNELLDYEPFFTFEYGDKAGLQKGFQEFYSEVVFDETLKQFNKRVIRALKKEQKAWKDYHDALDSTICVLVYDPNGYMGNTWYHTVLNAMEDDAYIWSTGLEDFSFPMMGSYNPEKHVLVSVSKVLREYQRFKQSLAEDDYRYPVRVRQNALNYEMSFWDKWMNSRAYVSSLLSGESKKYYDNATNNIRRKKYIMLKNRYWGYGVVSMGVINSLIPYTIPDEELDGPSIDEKWQ